MEKLNDDLLKKILEELSALELRVAARTCKSWRKAVPDNDRRLSCIVTSAGSNEVMLFDARGRLNAATKVKPTKWPPKSGKACPGFNWPTCVALGPKGELFVSQYRVSGVLQFARSPDGYAYQRTLASRPCFDQPEGVVHAHDSLYLASGDVISRLRLSAPHASQVLSKTKPYLDGYRYWGMTRGPDGHLYLAAHECDGGSYLEPTARNTGGLP